MKNHLFTIEDKELLKKRSLIEAVLNVLKNSMSLENLRHRSPINFVVHIMGAIAAYAIKKITNFAQIKAKKYASLS